MTKKDREEIRKIIREERERYYTKKRRIETLIYLRNKNFITKEDALKGLDKIKTDYE